MQFIINNICQLCSKEVTDNKCTCMGDTCALFAKQIVKEILKREE